MIGNWSWMIGNWSWMGFPTIATRLVSWFITGVDDGKRHRTRFTQSPLPGN